jgi:uncharacterized protein YqgC (DUF456 family)
VILPETVMEALSFGIAVVSMLIGVVGIVLPVLPGMIWVWLSLLAFAWFTDFQVVTPWVFAVLTLIALVTGTSNIWLPYLGAKKTGAAKRAIFLGLVGAIIGTFVIPIPLLGTVIGYALGIIVGELLKHRDLQVAIKASLGGVAGWGIATVVELAGALTIFIVFLVVALTG